MFNSTTMTKTRVLACFNTNKRTKEGLYRRISIDMSEIVGYAEQTDGTCTIVIKNGNCGNLDIATSHSFDEVGDILTQSGLKKDKDKVV